MAIFRTTGAAISLAENLQSLWPEAEEELAQTGQEQKPELGREVKLAHVSSDGKR
jgi:hypothetical protein